MAIKNFNVYVNMDVLVYDLLSICAREGLV